MAKEIANLKGQQAVSSNGKRRAIEEALKGIWTGVLRVPHIDQNANFFEIGGDSLKAMDVIARVSETLGVDLPLIAFFEEPTIRHLADVLAGEQKNCEEQQPSEPEKDLTIKRKTGLAMRKPGPGLSI